MMVLLVHSKSKAQISASRSFGLLNFARRVLMNQPCAPDGVSSGMHVALDAAVLDRREIVARRPDARGELLAEQIALGGEAFEADVAVAIIFVAHGVEVVLAARHRQIGAPPVRHALVFDVAAGLEAADLVGAAAERNVERRFVERPLAVIGAREDRQPGDEQRHVARALRRKAHDHGRVVGGLARRRNRAAAA